MTEVAFALEGDAPFLLVCNRSPGIASASSPPHPQQQQQYQQSLQQQEQQYRQSQQSQQQWESHVLAQRQQQMLAEDQFRNPYDPVLVPSSLPDMVASIPPELSQFRDQCASGVRQAVAMITAMEHQLAWERSRRQQAEDDCKVIDALLT